MTTITTSTITPVVRSFPKSMSCDEQSNLPFSMTVTPFGNTNHNHRQNQNPHEFALLTSIPKCYHCGAPHSSSLTYERLIPQRSQWHPNSNNTNNNNNNHYHPGLYYCRLCQKTFQYQPPPPPPPPISSNHYKNYDTNRPTKDDHDDGDLEDDTDPQQPQQRRALQRHKTLKVRNTSSSALSTITTTGTATTATTTSEEASSQPNHTTTTTNTSTAKAALEVTQVFDLPLRWRPNSTHSTTCTTISTPLYRRPALSCPLLWYICLDGGTVAVQTPSYWHHVATTLQASLDTAPSYVHIALLISTQRDGRRRRHGAFDAVGDEF